MCYLQAGEWTASAEGTREKGWAHRGGEAPLLARPSAGEAAAIAVSLRMRERALRGRGASGSDYGDEKPLAWALGDWCFLYGLQVAGHLLCGLGAARG